MITSFVNQNKTLELLEEIGLVNIRFETMQEEIFCHMPRIFCLQLIYDVRFSIHLCTVQYPEYMLKDSKQANFSMLQ